MKKAFLFLLLCFINNSAFSQTCELKHKITDEEKKEMLQTIKDLFNLSATIEYNFSTNDFHATPDKMFRAEAFDKEFLDKYEKLLQDAPSNPLYARQLGEYYLFHEQYLLATGYFESALKHRNISYFKNDSAAYYSFSGIIHYKLGDSTGLKELDKSLSINPEDSLGFSAYPAILIGNGEFDKVKVISRTMLERHVKYPNAPYLFFVMADVMGQSNQHDSKSIADSTYAKQEMRKDYDQFIDLKEINRLTSLYVDNVSIQHGRRMVDVMALMLKLFYFDKNKNNTPILSYTKKDIAKLKELNKWFEKALRNKSLNDYTAYKNIGYIQFMLNDNDKATTFFAKAIEVFPTNKRGIFFNETDVYSGLLNIASLKEDKTFFKNTLLAKIKTQPSGKEEGKDYRLMAEMYFYADSMSQAMDWAVKAKSIESTDYKTLLLLSHLSYLKGYYLSSDTYIVEANNYMAEKSNLMEFATVVIIYELLAGDVDKACATYDEVKKELEKEICEDCEQVMKKYVTVNSAK